MLQILGNVTWLEWEVLFLKPMCRFIACDISVGRTTASARETHSIESLQTFLKPLLSVTATERNDIGLGSASH